MKTYQCIHKYPPHIPAFEQRWGIGDHSTFTEIHEALLRDGYASVYRLVPSTNHPDDRVFFVVWDYDRLQITWARENGIFTTDLDEIRLAQIEKFEPDIVYDFSSFVSPTFAPILRERYKGLIICWNAFVNEDSPPANSNYDAHISLHRPFVSNWKSKGYAALELQPSVDPSWNNIEVPSISERPNDLIAYGQIGQLFKSRSKLFSEVAHAASSRGFDFKCFAEIALQYYRPGRRLARYGIKLPFLMKGPGKELRKFTSPPLYGINLYEGIRQAKAVLNSFGDLNLGFYTNMRIFETIGNGTPLLTLKGNYPDGLVDGIDYLSFESVDDITRHVKQILADPEAADAHVARAKMRMAENFGKERQYNLFFDFVTATL